ncbi:MAG: glycoside hydrolase family 88 protein [Coriobacteriia bacterium]
MIENARVPRGWRNEGLFLTGYVKGSGDWCLSSWIWTSSAIARYYSTIGRTDEVIRIADKFLEEQLPCGGWMVRLDWIDGCAVPLVAPNDSAYIANNALLEAYKSVGDEKYLQAAERCAAWIIRTARSDGLVYFGQNGLTGKWIVRSNIVDIGFTAGLFCELYKITNDDDYLSFAERFVSAYTRVFFDPDYRAFWTSVDMNGTPRGGHFARGQAWALEGLIPYYQMTGDSVVEQLIVDVTSRLVERQNFSGGWPYNLSRARMGEDGKGTPVLAKNLLDWYALSGEEEFLDSARRALIWCERHTMHEGGCPGGIFSYSVEGAVSHTLYSETAFTYSSAYALETLDLLRRSPK